MSKACSISDDGRHVTPCKALDNAVEFGNPTGRQKGLFAFRLHVKGELGVFEHRHTLYGAKSGGYVGGGVYFNFCPFCGERIRGLSTRASTAP